MRRIFISVISVSIILGCFTAYFIKPQPIIIACAIIFLFILMIAARHNQKVVLVSVCIITLLLGMFRVILTDKNTENTLAHEYTGSVEIKGVIIGDIEHKDTYSRYTVKILTIDGSEPEKESSVLAYEPYPTECVTGEEAIFSGRLKEPDDFFSSSGRIFKYQQYLRQFNIYATVNVHKNSCIGKKARYTPFATLRKHLVTAMHKIFPTQEASLLGGLVLGLRGSFSPELLEAFRVTGLIHIIILSGYNVTLIAETVRRLFMWTPRTVSFILSLLVIAAFVILAGAQTAAVRAGSMATIALIARTTYREYDGMRALLIVAMLMTLHNPDQVLFSVSFHMSFLATLGLLLFSSVFEDILKHVPKKFEIRQIISATLATQIFLLPYLAYAIGEVSLIGIPANIMILPIIPVAMLFGSTVTMVAVIMPTVAVIISPLAYLPLHTIIFVAEFLSQIPNVTTKLPEVSAALTVLLTLLLVFIGYEYNKKQKNNDGSK